MSLNASSFFDAMLFFFLFSGGRQESSVQAAPALQRRAHGPQPPQERPRRLRVRGEQRRGHHRRPLRDLHRADDAARAHQSDGGQLGDVRRRHRVDARIQRMCRVSADLQDQVS